MGRVPAEDVPPSSSSSPPRGALRPLDDEKVRFLLAGGWNTAFGYGVFTVLVLLFSYVMHYTLLLVIAYVVATLNAFVIYRRFVFRVRGDWVRDLIRFVGVYVVSLVLNLVALPVLVEVAGFRVLVAQAVAVCVTGVVSFVAHKRFSFRRQPLADPESGRLEGPLAKRQST
jgi:putative flippase GtrA